MAKDKRTYYEKLKDPKWQQMRLQVLKQANFTCERCGSTERTLHVHHGYYERKRDPWEYTLDTLHCFCELCHETVEELKQAIHIEIARLPMTGMYELLCKVQEVREKYPRDYKPCDPGYWDSTNTGM